MTEGYDPMYGARPLKRTLQRRVLDPLAMKVLEGEFREGDRIVVDAAGGELKFEARRDRTWPAAALDAARINRSRSLRTPSCTSRTYLPSTPLVALGAGGVHAALRRAISASSMSDA